MAHEDGWLGREVMFQWNGVEIEGVREKGITLNGESVNVTSDENNGWRRLLRVSGENSIDVSLSGVTKSQLLKTAWLTGQRTATATITYPDGSVLEFEAYLATFTDTGPYNDAMTFEASLQSSGEPTWTPYV